MTAPGGRGARWNSTACPPSAHRPAERTRTRRAAVHSCRRAPALILLRARRSGAAGARGQHVFAVGLQRTETLASESALVQQAPQACQRVFDDARAGVLERFVAPEEPQASL